MTNEEAIVYMELYKMRLTGSVSVGLEKDIESFNTAIKALEHDPICPSYGIDCEDCPAYKPKYCDRNICIQNEYNGIGCDECEVTKSQEPKTAHWILLDECSNSGYYCSKCCKKVVKEGWSNTVKKIKFCPNCGAKMEDQE